MPKRGRPSRLHAALGKIVSFFEGLPRKAFTEQELTRIFLQRSDEWRLAVNTTTAAFLRFLLENTPMREALITPLDQPSHVTALRYVWDGASAYAVASTIERGAYLSPRDSGPFARAYGPIAAHHLREPGTDLRRLELRRCSHKKPWIRPFRITPERRLSVHL